VRKWIPLAMLASAQFVMVLDTSVMNVAISQIVQDLHTTIQGVQTAITLYTLVMAAFMLLGAKLGDILSRNRAFAIGLAIYGAGSLTTALSPNLAVLLIGWSGVEGFGAVLVIPAIAALTAASYEGRERALAYALLGGVSAVAIAAGPLIGGWVTTEFSWRYVFASETVVVIASCSCAQIPGLAAERRPGSTWWCALSSAAPAWPCSRSSAAASVGLSNPNLPKIGGTRSRRSASRRRCSSPSAACCRVRRLGGAPRPPGPRPAPDTALLGPQLRAGLEPGRPAARPHGHVLRHPATPSLGSTRSRPASACSRCRWRCSSSLCWGRGSRPGARRVPSRSLGWSRSALARS
jgi:hypothetical protein